VALQIRPNAPGSISPYAESINPAGAITGYYTDATNAYHGFLRARDETITTFDAPGAGTASFQGTVPQGINPAGAITGYYTDASYAHHGFLRSADGTFTTFDPPGSISTYAESINPAGARGAMTGYYQDASFFGVHGFLWIP
jgi:hypothetical protein